MGVVTRQNSDRSRLLCACAIRLCCGDISKKYIAILDGELQSDEGIIDTYIKREAESIIFRTVCKENEGGDRAITKYKVLARNGAYTLVLASPITGRTHQLRVHCAHLEGLGHPIIGDMLYGGAQSSRLCLHAFNITFCHPVSGEHMTLETLANLY